MSVLLRSLMFYLSLPYFVSNIFCFYITIVCESLDNSFIMAHWELLRSPKSMKITPIKANF